LSNQNQGKNGYGILEHIWRIDNVPTGLNVQLRIEAHRSVLDPSDRFEFSYSTNGSSYITLGYNAVKDYDDNSEDIINLPSGTDNTIWIKVVNTDHAKGSKVCDALYIDCLYIVSSDGIIPEEVVPTETGPGNQRPVANAGPDQTVIDSDENGQEIVAINGSASFDPDGEIVSFEWDINNDGSTDLTGQTVTPALAVGDHTLTLTVTDDGNLSDSDQVLITVQATGGGGTMHVVDMTGTITLKGSSGQWTAFVTLTVVDEKVPDPAPVFGATVNGEWTGDASGTSSGITGSDGKVTLSSGNIKKGTTTTFTVTGIEHDTLTYTPDPQDQVAVTK
jgi:hypothetical protein